MLFRVSRFFGRRGDSSKRDDRPPISELAEPPTYANPVSIRAKRIPFAFRCIPRISHVTLGGTLYDFDLSGIASVSIT